ncbi:MAG: hypothetical protein WC760_07520 [Bacteroidia bacterium]|jgi:hypothetical protein
MKSLHPNWFFSEIPDLEYKRYILLAYLKEIRHDFNETKLYPSLSDLVYHYRNLSSFQRNKETLFASFPSEISEVDWKNFHIEFRKTIGNDELMNHLADVVNFSLPEIRKHIDEGKAIYDFIEQEIEFAPVGILPLYKNDGYMLVRNDYKPEIRVYEYEVKLFENETDTFRAVHTQYLTTYKKSLANTPENIKIDITRNRKKLPNPATFEVSSTLNYPVEETIIPIAKRLLMTFIN